jgi:cytoskeleton protein RodZ
MRGVTLDEISESTKISKRSLQALEDEEFGLLPGGIFNKGFVRSYARYLGIDEDEAVSDYVEASHEQAPPEDQFPLEIHEENEQHKPPLNPRRPVVPVALAVVALALGVGGWSYWVKFKPLQAASKQGTGNSAAHSPAPAPALEMASAAPSVSPANASAASSPVPANPGQPPAAPTANLVPSERSAKPSSSTADVARGSADSDPKTGNTSSAADSSKADKKADMAASADDPIPEMKLMGRFTVSVKAVESSYVRIVADGKTVTDGLMEANKERSVKAGKELVLRVGNAAGIEVSYQGKSLGPLGEEGKPRTLTFNAAGLQQ